MPPHGAPHPAIPGDFTIFEASNDAGPELIQRDAEMMKASAVLASLNPDTAQIPVIVSTAGTTLEEKTRLQGQIQVLLQTGDFMSDEFLEEVKALIR
jgi:threonine synthase